MGVPTLHMAAEATSRHCWRSWELQRKTGEKQMWPSSLRTRLSGPIEKNVSGSWNSILYVLYIYVCVFIHLYLHAYFYL